MKKLFLTLSLLLVVSFANANEKDYLEIKEITKTELNMFLELNLKVEKIKIINKDFTCKIYYGVYRKDGSLMGEFVLEAPDDHEMCGGFVGIQLSF
jgi:hypothetical protein